MGIDRNDFAPACDPEGRRLVLSDSDGIFELEPNHVEGTDDVAFIIGPPNGKWLPVSEARALRDALTVLLKEAEVE